MSNESDELVSEQASRMLAVTRGWLGDHQGEPVRLERADVQDIVYRLIEAHVHPTMGAVRQVNGGKGSPNVIHPALRDFFMSGELERRWKTPRPSEGVPEPLVSLWGELLVRARQDVRQEFDDAAETLKSREAAVEERKADLAMRERTVTERIDAQAALVERLQTEAENAARAVEQSEAALAVYREKARELLDAATTDRDVARQECAELQHRLADLEQKLALAIAACERLEGTRRSLEGSVVQGDERYAALNETLKEVLGQLKQAQSERELLTRQREDDRDAHRVAMDALRGQHKGVTTDMQNTIDQLREQAATTVAERNAAQAALLRADVLQTEQTAAHRLLLNTLSERDARLASVEDQLRAQLQKMVDGGAPAQDDA